MNETLNAISSLSENKYALFAFLGAIGIWGFVSLCKTVLKEKSATDINTMLETATKGQLLLQLVTVVLIVACILFLALLDKLGDGVLALLGTIGGYVLGGMSQRKEE